MSEELARRAVACKWWRWMQGAVDRHGRRVLALEVDDDGEKWLHYASQTGGGWLSLDMWPRGVGGVEAVPDLSDPATLGCLLALVGDALREFSCIDSVQAYHQRWRVSHAWQTWLMGGEDFRARYMVEALEIAS